ncbi:MAG: cation transporter, partial [Burkholderiaceae bacterium]
AANATVKLSVPGMNCASCPYMVKKAISAVDGVLSVSATLDDRSATVAFDDARTNGDQIRAATASIGYPSTVVPSTGD